MVEITYTVCELLNIGLELTFITLNPIKTLHQNKNCTANVFYLGKVPLHYVELIGSVGELKTRGHQALSRFKTKSCGRINRWQHIAPVGTRHHKLWSPTCAAPRSCCGCRILPLGVRGSMFPLLLYPHLSC